MRAFLFLSVLAVLISCCKDNDFVEIEKNGTIELELDNQDLIRVWCRSVCSFNAVHAGSYSVESQDTSIVKVSVQGNRFTVRSFNIGSTNIIIRNNLGAKKELTCKSCGFTKYWKEETNKVFAEFFPNTLMVVAKDTSVAELIKKELNPTYLNRGIQYEFVGESTMHVTSPWGFLDGKYSFDVAHQILTLNYGNISETYFCDIQPPYPIGAFVIALKQDLTEKYANEYPQAGVSDVYIIRHIISLSEHWLIYNNL